MYQDWGSCSEVTEELFSSESPFEEELLWCLLDHLAKVTHDEKRCSQVPPISTNPNQSGIWFGDTTDNQVSSPNGPTEQTMGNLCTNRRRTSAPDLNNVAGKEGSKRTVLMLCEPSFSLVEVQAGSM